MSLLARIRERLCGFAGCPESRTADSALCAGHLPMFLRNQLDRQPDGTFVARRRFRPVDLTGDLRATA